MTQQAMRLYESGRVSEARSVARQHAQILDRVGGGWLVSGASGIAAQFGMSEALIGMTVVAVGTSFPELAASVVAARMHPSASLPA